MVYWYGPGASVVGSKMPLNAPPPGAVHVPPACAPASEAKRPAGAEVEHKVIAPSVPAFGLLVSVTVTVDWSAAQGAVPATEYVYTPLAFTAGSYVPLNAPPPGAVHVPPACAPGSDVKRPVGAPTSQIVMLPSVPAFGAAFSVTVTVDWSLTHGAVALSVYV
jgi:hypothetical protein